MCLLPLLVIAASYCCLTVSADGAGRAFSIAAENFAIDNFKRVNPSIEWDYTNFLVDLSGFYANCKTLDRPTGVIDVDRTTPDGESIVAVVGSIEGTETDSDSTTGYIEELIKRWMTTNSYDYHIRDANRVGCSVRPGCNGYVVVVCLFASGSDVEQKHPTAAPTVPKTTRRRRRTTPSVASTPEHIVRTQPVTHPPITGEQRALAFTRQQYEIAESILGNEWDQSHFLENLSGFETKCSMVGTVQWEFSHTAAFNQQLGSNIKGRYGYARNLGSTPDALDTILKKFAQVPNAKELGCSIIPDCIDDKDGHMYVVISCLYEE